MTGLVAGVDGEGVAGCFCEDFVGGRGYGEVDLEGRRPRKLTVGGVGVDRECLMEELCREWEWGRDLGWGRRGIVER